MTDTGLYLILTVGYALTIWLAVRSARYPSIERVGDGVRTSKEKNLHLASGIFALAPFIWFFQYGLAGINIALVILSAQVLPLLLLQGFNVRWKVRLALMPFIAFASVQAGALALTWPQLAFKEIALLLWVTFTVAAVSNLVSNILSLFSFPLGFGARAH